MFFKKKDKKPAEPLAVAEPPRGRVWQEFFCNECIGYFRVKLNVSINEDITMVCPNCGHEHRRHVEAGVIYDGHKHHGKVMEVIVPRSAYSKEPFNKASRSHQRNGSVISKPSDINERHPAADALIKERWAELYGGRT